MKLFLALGVIAICVSLVRESRSHLIYQSRQQAFPQIRREPGFLPVVLLENAAPHLPAPFGEALLSQKLKLMDDHEFLDFVLLNMHSGLVKVSKMPTTTTFSLPDDGFPFDICMWNVCAHFENQASNLHFHFSGQHDTTFEEEITDNSIRNTFHLSKVNLSSPTFIYKLTGKDTLLWNDFELLIENMTTVFSVDYHHDPYFGIQISNLNIDHDVDVHQILFKNFTWILDTGAVAEQGTRLVDLKNKTMTEWKAKREEYQSDLEFRINCILSGGRIHPGKCAAEEESEKLSKYTRNHILTLFAGRREMNQEQEPSDELLKKFYNLLANLYNNVQWIITGQLFQT